MTFAPALALTTPSSAAAPRATAAPSSPSAWSAVSARPGASHDGNVRQVAPSSYRAYTLDDAALAASLAGAPRAGSPAAEAGAGVTVQVPAPNGRLVTLNVVQSDVLAPELAAKHPEIKAYVGKAVGYADSVSIQVTPFGTHVSVRGAHPAWFVDPAYQNDDSLYLSYFGRNLPAPQKAFAEPELDQSTVEHLRDAGQGIGEGPNGLVRHRLYRLALLTDPSYANYVAPGLNDGAHEAESDSAVLAAKTVLVSRVNDIYGDDLGVELQLIAQSDKLNLNLTSELSGANGPCGADPCFPASGSGSVGGGCVGALLTRNRLAVGQLVGAASFDIGHIGLGINGGGIASLGVVGGSSKAQGCTGLPFPTGDFYAIDYVAHEMGHQFSGNHTFNGTQINCSGGNRSAAASVEPGSGSSVMAYAGICGSDDLQPHTDPYFSQRSQTEIGAYINSALNNVSEVQTVAFNGGVDPFDGTDSFTLTFTGPGGPVTTAPITRGTNYDAASVAAAIQAVTGGTVTVTPHFSTAAVSAQNPFTDAGFTVSYGGALAGVDVPNPTLNPTGFTGYANDIAKGGPPTNGGITVTTTSNHNPVVTAPADKTIPMRTPFTLTGSATDSDGDSLLYLWEQNDRGAAAGTGLVDNVKKNGPLFRVFGKYADVTQAESLQYYSDGENLADGNPSRTFPDMDQILNGWTNAATGTCPAPANPAATLPNGPELECFSEFLPTSDYVGDGTAGNTEPSLDFRLTARDDKGPNGGTDFDDVKLRIDKTAGPFQVTSQAAPVTYEGNTTQTVTWAVNGTNTPALAQNVKISFSADGGRTFPTVLAASTPNDGSADVAIPVAPTTTGRIKIEAVGNYFFDVNDAPITVTDHTAPNTTITTGPAEGSIWLSTVASFGLSSDESPVTYSCAFDGAALACPSSPATKSGIAAGTHTFTAAATDGSGNSDPSPATRTFTVPVDDAALTVTKGSWGLSALAGAFLDTVSTSKKKGATLSTTVTNATSLALVAWTGKKGGTVQVLLNGHLLKTISLNGAPGQVVIPVATFSSPQSGKVTIVNHTKKAHKKKQQKTVVIDGLGVVSAR
ncbi:MAG TPA: M12 family metallo-peptidase [Nocardioides sp.]|nr:M12 family metallo-peptidase [Nocardioides sp.]